ncbi:cell division protein FtsQ [Betaproteobacteria bacterium]|nr:cell division protein FtsQ [Betaproteobacteria bacterium]GHU00751.1 cell division protein FtsQ [Betaproteobacteria bacterium]GHU17596.1 cell division protein FtsQ [Betaproteobacteria bacterium]
MAERYIRSAAVSPRVVRPHARRETGLWHRPEVLDLISDLLFLFALISLSYAAFVWVKSQPFFPLGGVVVVTPIEQVPQDQLEYVARTSIRGNFFTTELDDVRIAFESVPWVRRVEVRRRWPNEIELAIEEQQAVAYWKTPGSEATYLLNQQGEVFDADSDADMPLFSGPEGSSSVLLQRYQGYSQMLAPLGARLVGVELSARGAWQLRLDNGLTIVLGREQEPSSLDGRLARFVAAWAQIKHNIGERFARVDLRYPGGFALTPAGTMTAPPGVAGGKRR